MTKQNYKIISNRNINIETARVWELIFFMFWDDYMESDPPNKSTKGYKTESAILQAIQSYYKDQAVTDIEKRRLANLSQSGISKGLKALKKPVVYQGETYIIQKMSISDNLPEQKEYRLKVLNLDIKERIWKEELHILLSADVLVKDQMCPVSKHMYIFKIKPPQVRIKKQTQEELSTEKYENKKRELEKEQLRKNVKIIKKHFRKMIDSATLFDVTASGDKIMVLLNKSQDIPLYTRLFDNFFKPNQ